MKNVILFLLTSVTLFGCVKNNQIAPTLINTAKVGGYAYLSSTTTRSTYAGYPNQFYMDGSNYLHIKAASTDNIHVFDFCYKMPTNAPTIGTYTSADAGNFFSFTTQRPGVLPYSISNSTTRTVIRFIIERVLVESDKTTWETEFNGATISPTSGDTLDVSTGRMRVELTP